MVWVKCPKCGYVWNYRGKRISVTCPSCRHTFMLSRGVVNEAVVTFRIARVPKDLVEVVERCAGLEHSERSVERLIVVDGVPRFLEIARCIDEEVAKRGSE